MQPYQSNLQRPTETETSMISEKTLSKDESPEMDTLAKSQSRSSTESHHQEKRELFTRSPTTQTQKVSTNREESANLSILTWH